MEKSKKINSVITKGKILEQINLDNNYYRIKIEAPQIAKEAKPGQFVMLSKWKIKQLLLKRPFSFCQIEPNLGTFDILYKKVGKGTQILSESKIGDLVELIGPLGNGFNISESVKKIAVVARGIGVAPLIPLILECNKRGIEIYSFLSAQTENLLLYNDKIESISKKIFYTTDDGSKGTKDIVTNFLGKVLEETNINLTLGKVFM